MTSPECIGLDEFGADQAPRFRVTILFENKTIGDRAVCAACRLIEKFSDHFKFQLTVASFAELEGPAQFKDLLEISRSADMVFVASDSPLPETIVSWLKECIREHVDAPYALADMTREGVAHVLEIDGFVRMAGRRYAVEVIRQETSMQSRYGPSNYRQANFREMRHWGINE